MRENVGLELSEMGNLVRQDMEKTELLNAAFASFFTSKNILWECQVSETWEKGWNKKNLPLVEEHQVRE